MVLIMLNRISAIDNIINYSYNWNEGYMALAGHFGQIPGFKLKFFLLDFILLILPYKKVRIFRIYLHQMLYRRTYDIKKF